MNKNRELKTKSSILPIFFPLVHKNCRKVASSLFQCLEEEGKRQLEIKSLQKGDNISVICNEYIESYNSCMIQEKFDQQLKLVRMPEAYLDQVSA